MPIPTTGYPMAYPSASRVRVQFPAGLVVRMDIFTCCCSYRTNSPSNDSGLCAGECTWYPPCLCQNLLDRVRSKWRKARLQRRDGGIIHAHPTSNTRNTEAPLLHPHFPPTPTWHCRPLLLLPPPYRPKGATEYSPTSSSRTLVAGPRKSTPLALQRSTARKTHFSTLVYKRGRRAHKHWRQNHSHKHEVPDTRGPGSPNCRSRERSYAHYTQTNTAASYNSPMQHSRCLLVSP